MNDLELRDFLIIAYALGWLAYCVSAFGLVLRDYWRKKSK